MSYRPGLVPCLKAPGNSTSLHATCPCLHPAGTGETVVVPPPGLCTLGDNSTQRGVEGAVSSPGMAVWTCQGPALRQGIQGARPMYWNPDAGVTQDEVVASSPQRKNSHLPKSLSLGEKSAVFLGGCRWDSLALRNGVRSMAKEYHNAKR